MAVTASLIICPETYPGLARRIMWLAVKHKIPRWLWPLLWPLTQPRKKFRRT